MKQVRVVNFTNFFNRELMIYSLGDIKFKKPMALKRVAYITGFLILWSLPIFFIVGVYFNPFYFAFWLGVPIFAGHIASKPVFGGKGLIDFTKSLVGYVQEPKGWVDTNPTQMLDHEVYYVEQEMWISRRRELEKLAKLQSKEGLS